MNSAIENFNKPNILIRRYRKYRQLSLQDLSKLTNIHQLTLSKFELNKLDISLTKFIKIINALQIDRQELVNVLFDE